jgi:hypothetical protein
MVAKLAEPVIEIPKTPMKCFFEFGDDQDFQGHVSQISNDLTMVNGFDGAQFINDSRLWGKLQESPLRWRGNGWVSEALEFDWHDATGWYEETLHFIELRSRQHVRYDKGVAKEVAILSQLILTLVPYIISDKGFFLRFKVTDPGESGSFDNEGAIVNYVRYPDPYAFDYSLAVSNSDDKP